ncbi:hypothetical protein DFS33DRAFT_1277312 [Desarmillaria ectypa]|nr:hypothetical protein DFS33DRAFT_1277312 [Desarmillaria ectypa]
MTPAFVFTASLALLTLVSGSAIPRQNGVSNPRVLILGGGVAGVIAARTLHEEGIDNFLIIEARDELGGRMRSHAFAGYTVEIGANWVQGTQTGTGPANPIYELVKKHNITTEANSFHGSMTTYDNTGEVDYLDVLEKAADAYTALTVTGGSRVAGSLVDLNSKTGYAINGAKPRTAHEMTAEYYHANNFTFDADQGGFSEDNLLSIDQRGFKTLIQLEAEEFLQPEQVVFDSRVTAISYSTDGVQVTLADGSTIEGDYALCTFSLGVLQDDVVQFQPPLPAYKVEAIQSMTMGTYTKIFLNFPKKFWFDKSWPYMRTRREARSGLIFATVTSLRVETLADDQVKREVLDVLQHMFPDTIIPEPTDFYFPRWNADPLYRGSFSNWPPSFFSEHHENLRANVDRLYFAGEATSQKYFGYLHGAYDEGVSVVKAMVTCIKGDGYVELQHVKDVKNAFPYQI